MRRILDVVVAGFVQGVGYREACARYADLMGVKGWARNRVDGRVELHFEGEPYLIKELLAWCWLGTADSIVREVKVTPGVYEACEGFTVR